MSVKIRMKRIGAKNKPAFRIVVADSRSPRDGKCLEELGTYLPQQKQNNFTLDLERAKYWVSKGAQPSETVASFIKKAAKSAAVAARTTTTNDQGDFEIPSLRPGTYRLTATASGFKRFVADNILVQSNQIR